MYKNKKAEKIFNISLIILYVFISIFSWLMQMASEGTIDANNQLYISLIDLFCIISLLVPIFCTSGIFLSFKLREKGYRILSFVVSVIPFLIFVLNFILLAYAETLPRII